ncbi:MAG: NAD(P)/FAD-dependent oxidoreductase [Actinomycetota bacterium]
MRAGVIGAGPGGLVAAKVLIEDGFDVTLYERADRVGGLWVAGRCYEGLHNQSVRGLFEFADLPNDLHMASAADTYRYLKEYACRYGIPERVRFGTDVVAVGRHKTSWTVRSRPFGVTDGASDVDKFDYVVVASGAHHHPHLPELPGRDRFAGTVLHSHEVTAAKLLGRRVAVVGGGKSALDISILAARHGASSTNIQRKVNWFVPERILGGRVTYDRVLLTRLGAALLPQYHNPSVVRIVDRVPSALKAVAWKLIGWDLLRSAGLRGVDRELLRPRGPLPFDLTHTGVMPNEYVRGVQDGKIAVNVSAVSGFTANGLRLANGEQVETDMVVFATGHRIAFPFLDGTLELYDDQDRPRLYRGIVPPGVPGLGFIGFRQTFNNVLAMEIAAHWLSSYFQCRLVEMPSPQEMERSTQLRLEWQERVLPGSEGYDFGPYDIHCIDELLHDMGLRQNRERWLLSEYFSPAAVGRRYRNLGAERRDTRPMPSGADTCVPHVIERSA